MMDPRTAVWMAGRADPNRDRDAEQAAALRNADSDGSSSSRSMSERVQAFFTTSGPSSASSDCSDC